MPDIPGIIDSARLLRRGDVVAIKTGRPLHHSTLAILREQLGSMYEETGVKFLVFEDVDLEVFRPVDERDDQGAA